MAAVGRAGGRAAGWGLTAADRQLPPALAERARAFAADGDQPVAPRASATVALLRDGGSGPEVYVLRRVSTMAFAAGMYVFPGGTVDPRDAETSIGWAGPSPGDWARLLTTDVTTARELVCAAVRETFEESGVLLAGATADEIVPDTTGADWEADREGLVGHRVALAEVLARRGLVLRTDLLRPVARWVTPEFEPRRYDTFIFLAALPTGQRTRDVGGEADRVAWVRAADAVTAFRAGTMPMLPPTLATFIELAAAGSVHEALQQTGADGLAPITPRPVVRADGAYVVLPGDAEYDA